MDSLNEPIPSRPSNLSSIFDAIIPSLFSFSKRTPGSKPRAPTPPTAAPPHPFAFFTSGYMLGLLLLAIVLHRIKHTVVPNPIHATRTPAHHSPQNPRSRRRSFQIRILPLDLAHTPTRLALHLPTLYLLSKALALWTLIVLTSVPVPVAPSLVAWLARHETHEVCWLTFCAICAAFCVEAFIRALDGRGLHGPLMGMGAGENMNTSPFNLVGYAILLHSYASPVKHQSTSPSNTPSRPDKHAAIIITIPLLQLTLLHILSVSKHHSTHRLLPTALASLLSLAHFHTTLLSYIIAPKRLTPPPPTPTLPDPPATPPVQSAGAGVSSLPALNYIPNTFETLLVLSIALSAALDRLARLLVHTDAAAFRTRPRRRQHSYTDHTAPSSSFADTGSSSSSDGGFFSRLPYDEDFGVVLLRAGLRSLEGGGTHGRGGGWRNEVGGIYLSVREQSRHQERDNPFSLSLSSPNLPNSGLSGHQRQRRARGFANEVRTAHASGSVLGGQGQEGTETSLGWAEDMFGARRVVQRLKMWARFFVAIGKGAVRGLSWVGKGVWGILWVGKGDGRRREVRGRDGQGREGEEEDFEEEEEAVIDEREWQDEMLYQRFLRGDVSDGEEDEDYIGLSDEDPSEDLDSEEDDNGEERGLWDGQKEALRLLGELIFGAGSSRPSGGGAGADAGAGTYERDWDRDGTVREAGQLVLARLFGSTQGPGLGGGMGTGVVTRRRWQGGLSLPPETGTEFRDGRRGIGEMAPHHRVDSWIEDRRAAGVVRWGKAGEEREEKEREERERDRCVVCMTEGREVICWPCRCLAMCNPCREALAAQSAASTHRCPCCRRGVDGFSRIYVP